MKNNYPIKYALVPMIEQVGWSSGLHDLEREYKVVYYIAAKCYLVEVSKKYKQKGDEKVEYHVVFPFKYKLYSGYVSEEPRFNCVHGNCVNEIITDKIFDSYGAAKSAKELKNEELLDKKIKYSFGDKRQLKRKEFSDTSSYYDELEAVIERETQDLQVLSMPKEQTVIMYKDGKYKKVNSSLYEMISLYKNEDFIAYSVEEYQYHSLNSQSDGQLIYNNRPLIVNSSKNKIAKVFSPDGDTKYLQDDTIIDESDFESPQEYEVIFYTIETYDDVITSYSMGDNQKVIKIERKY